MSRTIKDERQGDMFAAPPPAGREEQDPNAYMAETHPAKPHDQPPSRAKAWEELAEEEEIATREFEEEYPEDEREDDPEDDAPPVVQPPVSERPADPLGEALVGAGLAPNDFILNLNHSITADHAELVGRWALPSRLFRFPIEVSEPSRDDEGNWQPRAIGLMHPLLGDHPTVKRVEEALGFELARDGAPKPYGYSKTRLALWWHACDLCTKEHWRDLLASREFTTDGDIVRAVTLSLDYAKGITTKDARAILEEVGAPRPEGFADRDALATVELTEFTGEKGTIQRPLNPVFRETKPTCEQIAWGRIIGIERGWFAYKGGYLRWTDAAKATGSELL